MQIVINLPDTNITEDIIRAAKWEDGSLFDMVLRGAMRDAIILPKGHGKLIDVGQCDRKLFYQQCGGADSLIAVQSAFDMLLSLPIIIEADKENKE